MATEPSPQRAYRAACPNCGAPVDFRSAASAFAVCGFCRSTLVREGEALRKIGESAELFDDHSPLQLGASGKYQGSGFTLVGRLQYRYKDGTWNEWHALFDNGAQGQKSGWLSEDNGRYVMAFDVPLDGAPPAEQLRAGVQQVVAGQAWTVASVTAAKLIAAQGELPFKPNTERGFLVADLRSTRDEVGTLDYSDPVAPKWSIGRAVAIGELAMVGLADGADGSFAKALKARSIECPSCGTSLEVKLSTTQSIVCHQCHAVVDLTSAAGGVGGDLAHYAQDNGLEPQIPLGTTGTLALGPTARPWQVVGYVERCEVDDEEQAFWREYLLYHRTEGFAFLVDAEDGWSWTAPITGVPVQGGDTVRYQGTQYRKLYDYTGKITYVLGEFYWQLKRGELTYNTDYQGAGSAKNKRLNRERTEGEIVWSAGETLASDVVAKAFRLTPDRSAALKRDTGPTSGNAAGLLAKVFFWVFIVVILLALFRCDDDDDRRDCAALRSSYGEASQEYQNCLASNRSGGYRTSGGAWGGFSSGGGHK